MKKLILTTGLFLALTSPAFAGTKFIHLQDGAKIDLYEPISVQKTVEGNGLTNYLIMDNDSDEMGRVLDLAVQEGSAGRTMTLKEGYSDWGQVPSGSQMESDCLYLISLSQ